MESENILLPFLNLTNKKYIPITEHIDESGKNFYNDSVDNAITSVILFQVAVFSVLLIGIVIISFV